MGAKSKAAENGLVELIVDKWEGGKNTIVYVTQEVNREIQARGLHVTFSRESIRRVIKSHEEEIAVTKRATEAAKAMASVLQDKPGTEFAEGILLKISTLIAEDLRSIESLEFETPEALCQSVSRLAETQLKLSAYRTKAVKALDKAKEQLKAQLQKEITGDPELFSRLSAIIDKAEVA